jgi:hypothetical protein
MTHEWSFTKWQKTSNPDRSFLWQDALMYIKGQVARITNVGICCHMQLCTTPDCKYQIGPVQVQHCLKIPKSDFSKLLNRWYCRELAYWILGRLFALWEIAMMATMPAPRNVHGVINHATWARPSIGLGQQDKHRSLKLLLHEPRPLALWPSHPTNIRAFNPLNPSLAQIYTLTCCGGLLSRKQFDQVEINFHLVTHDKLERPH